MKKTFILIIFATMSFFGYSQDWFGFNRYKADNERIIASGNYPEVVFMGNSITDNWAYFHPDFFSSHNFCGRGIGGQTSAQMLVRFNDDVIVGCRPNEWSTTSLPCATKPKPMASCPSSAPSHPVQSSLGVKKSKIQAKLSLISIRALRHTPMRMESFTSTTIRLSPTRTSVFPRRSATTAAILFPTHISQWKKWF